MTTTKHALSSLTIKASLTVFFVSFSKVIMAASAVITYYNSDPANAELVNKVLNLVIDGEWFSLFAMIGSITAFVGRMKARSMLVWKQL